MPVWPKLHIGAVTQVGHVREELPGIQRGHPGPTHHIRDHANGFRQVRGAHHVGDQPAGADRTVTTTAAPAAAPGGAGTFVADAGTEAPDELAGALPGTLEHPDTFAAWMSTALRREGLTQEAAARMLGVSVKTVSRWVGGATEPRMRDLRRIQEVFGEVPIS